jgi:hypothetical protein
MELRASSLHKNMSATTRALRFDFVSLGEPMLRLTVPTGWRLDDIRSLDPEFASAESNVRTALSRLGGALAGSVICLTTPWAN